MIEMEFIMFSVNIYILGSMDHDPKMDHDIFGKGSRPKNGYRPRRIDLFYRSSRIDPLKHLKKFIEVTLILVVLIFELYCINL